MNSAMIIGAVAIVGITLLFLAYLLTQARTNLRSQNRSLKSLLELRDQQLKEIRSAAQQGAGLDTTADLILEVYRTYEERKLH